MILLFSITYISLEEIIMKKRSILVTLMTTLLLTGCKGLNAHADTAYARIPREESGLMFELTQLPSTAPETAEYADTIVYGTVRSVETTSWNALISTSLEFEVEQVLKGNVEQGSTITVKSNNGAMLQSELRKGYSGVIKEAAEAHSQSGKLDTELEDDCLVVQLLPYGGLFTSGTKEVLCLEEHDMEEGKIYTAILGKCCRQIEVNDGELADLYDIKVSMGDLGFDKLRACDPALMPDNLFEQIPVTRNLEQIREMYELD